MTIQELCATYDEAELSCVAVPVDQTMEEQTAAWSKLSIAKQGLMKAAIERWERMAAEMARAVPNEHVKEPLARVEENVVVELLAELLYFNTWHTLRGGWKAFAR